MYAVCAETIRSTSAFTAMMRRAVSGLPWSKSPRLIASLTLRGMFASPPNMSAIVCRKRSRVALFASLSAWDRQKEATLSPPSATTIVCPASGPAAAPPSRAIAFSLPA